MRTLVGILVALCLAGCGDQGTLVVVSVDSSTPMPDVASLHASATAGGRTRDFTIPLSSPGIPPAITFGVKVPPSVTGSFAITVEALDGSGATLATAMSSTTLQKGKRVDLPLDLATGGSPPDMAGGDDGGGGGDGGAPDMTTPDLALTSTAALFMVRQGASVDIPLTVTRGPGVTGDVTVTVSGLPTNVAAQPLTILAADTKGALTLVAAAQASQGGPTTITVTGSNGTVMGTLQLGLVVGGQPGTLDQSFGTNGSTIIDFPTGRSDTCSTVAVAPDLKPIIGGNSADPTTFVPDIGVARLTLTGGFDNTFGANGRVRKHVNDSEGEKAVAVQPDGKIVAVGRTSSDGTNFDVLVVRFNTDGNVDGTFGTAGVVTVDAGAAGDAGNAVALQSDAKIVVAGSLGNGANFVLRLNGDGSLDTTFGTGGKTTLTAVSSGAQDTINAVAIRSDGKIIVAGTGSNTDQDALVMRLTAAGAVDTAFGTNGHTFLDGPYHGADVINGITLGSDNAIYAAATGQLSVSGTNQPSFEVLKFTPDGAADPSFTLNANGVALINWHGKNDDGAYGIGVQPADGKVVVSGTARLADSTKENALIRFTAGGSVDTTFGNMGRVEINLQTGGTTGFDGAYALALMPDGRIVVGGFVDEGTVPGGNSQYDCSVIRVWP